MSEELVVRLDAVAHEIKITMSDPDTLIPVMMLEGRGPAGPRGASANALWVIGEIPTGAVNNSNADFTAGSNFVPETVQVILNGLTQRRIADFNTTGTNQFFLTESPQAGDFLQINYQLGD